MRKYRGGIHVLAKLCPETAATPAATKLLQTTHQRKAWQQQTHPQQRPRRSSSCLLQRQQAMQPEFAPCWLPAQSLSAKVMVE